MKLGLYIYLHILRILGKAAALKTGIYYAINLNFDLIINVNADRQRIRTDVSGHSNCLLQKSYKNCSSHTVCKKPQTPDLTVTN